MDIILGIDPGSQITGYGVIKLNRRKIEYLTSGCIRTRGQNLPEKLGQIYTSVTEIIKEFNPTTFAIEEVFMAKNANSALKLGQARASAIVAAVNFALPVSEYAARFIKQAVVGKGNADKIQVQHMVVNLLHLNAFPQIDAADALAVAICHAHMKSSKLIASGRF